MQASSHAIRYPAPKEIADLPTQRRNPKQSSNLHLRQSTNFRQVYGGSVDDEAERQTAEGIGRHEGPQTRVVQSQHARFP